MTILKIPWLFQVFRDRTNPVHVTLDSWGNIGFPGMPRWQTKNEQWWEDSEGQNIRLKTVRSKSHWCSRLLTTSQTHASLPEPHDSNTYTVVWEFVNGCLDDIWLLLLNAASIYRVFSILWCGSSPRRKLFNATRSESLISKWSFCGWCITFSVALSFQTRHLLYCTYCMQNNRMACSLSD